MWLQEVATILCWWPKPTSSVKFGKQSLRRIEDGPHSAQSFDKPWRAKGGWKIVAPYALRAVEVSKWWIRWSAHCGYCVHGDNSQGQKNTFWMFQREQKCKRWSMFDSLKAWNILKPDNHHGFAINFPGFCAINGTVNRQLRHRGNIIVLVYHCHHLPCKPNIFPTYHFADDIISYLILYIYTFIIYIYILNESQ